MCRVSGSQEWFEGLNCVDQCVKHFRQNRFKGATLIVHNARWFDGYLILQHYVRLRLTPSLIMQGSKVLQFVDPDFRLKFINSLSFLTMPLSQLPKALGCTDKVKGFFPYKFSSKDRLHYVGPYPQLADYDVDGMLADKQRSFFDWYRTVSGGVFNFETEAL